MSFDISTKNLWLYAVSVKRHDHIVTKMEAPNSIWRIEEKISDDGVWFDSLVILRPQGSVGFMTSKITELTTKGGVVLNEAEDILKFLQELQ